MVGCRCCRRVAPNVLRGRGSGGQIDRSSVRSHVPAVGRGDAQRVAARPACSAVRRSAGDRRGDRAQHSLVPDHGDAPHSHGARSSHGCQAPFQDSPRASGPDYHARRGGRCPSQLPAAPSMPWLAPWCCVPFRTSTRRSPRFTGYSGPAGDSSFSSMWRTRMILVASSGSSESSRSGNDSQGTAI